MLKREELSNPESCFNRAKSHEMIFVLLARDAVAPYIVRRWARERVEHGKNDPHDQQILEALNCANTMADQHSGIRLQLIAERDGHKPVNEPDPFAPKPRYAIIAYGEGAQAAVIAENDELHEAVHRFMCCCGKHWRECTCGREMIQDIELIDQPDAWSTDEDGEPFCVSWPHETGRITLYRLSEPHAVRTQAEKMWKLIRDYVLCETSQTSYAELKGSQSMDIPVEFLALCEFAEEMGVKLP